MTDQDILEKIKNSANDIEIPDSIEPETIKERLEEIKRRQQAKRAKNRKIGGITAAAACLMIAYTAHVFVFSSDAGKDMNNYADEAAATMDIYEADEIQKAGGTKTEGGEPSANGNAAQYTKDNDSAAEENTEGNDAKTVVAKRDAGDMYTVAKDYGEVYDMLKEYEEELPRYAKQEYFNSGMSGEDGASTSGSGGLGTSIKYDAMESVQDLAVPAADAEEESYSTTNLQTAGVDESDIIKNDGTYIYTVDEEKVNIVDVSGDKMKVVGTIELQYQTAADRIVEMYIDGNSMNLIVERKKTYLSKKESSEEIYEAAPMGQEGEDTVYVTDGSGFLPLEETEETAEDYDVFFTETDTFTEILTYDITDRSGPKLSGSVEQQGYYNTSRKIGDIVYLFTTTSVSQPQMQRSAAVEEKRAGGWIPLVNGEPVAADCIYLPREEGNRGLLISSVNIKQPEIIVDHTLILSNAMNTYVSADAFYLYYESYDSSLSTMIAKFSLKDGYMNAVDAASVKGSIYDTFAINENNGKLRVLTTDWSNGENSNALYLLDENMKMTGKLEGIAKGEEIYAARYLGNTAYFVTYRNTDPLFAVDLTDEKNPIILSELKITGFSEYLHFWGEDKLFGIGYETDPDSGRREGIKISMFDISDPSNLTTLNSCVIAEADYSPALYNYKCVLVDAKENLIGFAMQEYAKEYQNYYALFQWQDGKFDQVMTELLDEYANLENYRGIYIGNRFFVAAPDEIISFERESNYRMKEKIEL